MKNKLSLITIISLILGIIIGILFPELSNNISFVGTIYINLLKFIIIPIIFVSLLLTIYKTKGQGKIFIKTIIIFIIMFLITFLLSSLIFLIFKNFNFFDYKIIEHNTLLTDLKVTDIIVNLFPSNLVSMIENNNLFFTIILSVVAGYSCKKIKSEKVLIEVIEGIKDVLIKILEYIMYLTPLAVLSLTSSSIANYGSTLLGTGVKYIILAYIISLIVMIFVMIIPACITLKMNPFIYIKKVYKVWIISLTTCSSLATLPETIKTCNKSLNIPEKITDIVVPLGCTIHMCGGAVSFSLLALFSSHIFGIEISLLLYLKMIVLALLINMAAPGIPGGGIVIGASFLNALGIPLDFIGFYSGIYKVLDMSYTTLNVSGDITANVIVNKIK